MIFCIFVLAFDLLYGHMGRLSFGHMLYLGAGAYGAALSALPDRPDPFWPWPWRVRRRGSSE